MTSILHKMREFKLKIEGFLKSNPRGLSIEEVSSRAKLNRQATTVILAELKGEKKVVERVVGRAKLHYWDFKEAKERASVYKGAKKRAPV